MNIRIVTPAPRGSRSGNRVTAERWGRILRQLGHRATVGIGLDKPCDLLIALHASKSARPIRLHQKTADTPLVIDIAGTDLRPSQSLSRTVAHNLARADHIVLLQKCGLDSLPSELRAKARIIHQSVEPPKNLPSPRANTFDVCVIGHQRPIKDPFRAALAARLLPDNSKIRILHAGAALHASMDRQARREQQRNQRYRWLGELDRARSLRLMARSHLMVISSLAEGGANVIGEAIACGTPILSSRIPGSVGLLGTDYPGFFEVRDTAGLADLLIRAETSTRFYQKLHSRCRQIKPIFHPSRERKAWRKLLAEIS